jgi:hypothetical protein
MNKKISKVLKSDSSEIQTEDACIGEKQNLGL